MSKKLLPQSEFYDDGLSQQDICQREHSERQKSQLLREQISQLLPSLSERERKLVEIQMGDIEKTYRDAPHIYTCEVYESLLERGTATIRRSHDIASYRRYRYAQIYDLLHQTTTKE